MRSGHTDESGDMVNGRGGVERDESAKLTLLMLITAVSGVGAGLGAHALIQSQSASASPEPAVLTIGGMPLVVPAGYVRAPPRTTG